MLAQVIKYNHIGVIPMTMLLGDEEEKVVVDDTSTPTEPAHPFIENEIGDKINLTKTATPHKIVSSENVLNKRPWDLSLSKDMFTNASIALQGSRESVTYISMVKHDGMLPSGDSAAVANSHREYIEIKDYPIYLDGDGFTADTDAINKETETVSSMNIGGVLPPTEGDYFVMKTDYTRYSLFEILRVKPLSIQEGTAYAVEYQMAEVSLGELYEIVKAKITRRLSYVRKNHMLGVKYLLTDEEITQALESDIAEDNLLQEYLSEFYDEDLKVFAIPSILGFHTDMIIQGFLSQIAKCPDDMFTYPEYAETAKFKTIFDVMLSRMPIQMPNVLTKVYYYPLINPCNVVRVQPVLSSPVTTMPFQKSSRMMEAGIPTPVRELRGAYLGATQTEIGISDIFAAESSNLTTYFPDVLNNETYILSADFYSDTGGSLLELLLYKVINSHIISSADVMTLVSQRVNLTKEERFFIVPFIIYLVKVLKRG